jgi:glycosyltransferase involved in cell wall biosynthesis
VNAMETVKVCLLTSEFLPNWGGVGTYCIELARALADKVELHVVTLGRMEKGKLVYSEEDMQDFFDGAIEVHLLTTSPAKDTFIYNAKIQLSAYRKLHKIAKEHNLDLIHSNFPSMPDLLLKIGRKTRIPSIATIHTTIKGHKDGIMSSGLSFFRMDFSEKCTLLLYPALELAQQLYLRKSKELITVSYWMRAILEKNYPFISKLHVIHNGVDSRRFKPQKPNKSQMLSETLRPIVLFSSRLTVAKGVHYFIQAIPQILKQTKDVHFVFSGAGPREQWISLLRKLKIDESFYTFLGYIDYKLLPSLYAKADIFAAPSLYENLPIRILEAMSCESAVVASNICAIPEAITNGENGVLISPGDVDELARVITMLLKDDKLRSALGKNARQTVIQNFCWDVIAEKTVETYKKLLRI